jgi:hypothetical protein
MQAQCAQQTADAAALSQQMADLQIKLTSQEQTHAADVAASQQIHVEVLSSAASS